MELRGLILINKKTLLLGSLLIWLLCLLFLSNTKALASNPMTDASAEALLKSRCIDLPPETQTIHILYLDDETLVQTNNSVTAYLKAVSHRCDTASGSATNVGLRLDSTTNIVGSPTNNITAPDTYYTGVTVAVNDFSPVVSHGQFTISSLSVGINTIQYNYTAYSFSSSAQGWDYISFTPGDVCPNIAGLQYPNPPAGKTIDGSGNCVSSTDVCPNITGNQATVPVGYTKIGSDCVPDGGGPSGSINCPSYPPYLSFSNPIQRVDLPRGSDGEGTNTDAWSDWSQYGAVSGPSTSDDTSGDDVSSTYTRTYTYTRKVRRTQLWRKATQGPEETIVDSALDKIWFDGTTREATPYGNVMGAISNSSYVLLDYTIHSINYPYDTHQPQVTYRIGYERYRRIQEGTETYTTTKSYTITRSKTVEEKKKADGTSYSPIAWNDPVYGAWSSGSYGADPSPSWPAPLSGVYTVTEDDLSYGGRADKSNYEMSGKLYIDAPVMPPCFPREYIANPTGTSASFSEGTQESPTQSSFSFTIPTTLNFTHGGSLRTATIVNGISYTVNWAAEGYSSPNIGGSFSRTTNISNTSTSNGAIGTASDVSTEYTSTFSIPTDIEAGDRICWTVTVNLPNGYVGAGSVRGTKLTAAPYPQTGPSVTSAKTCTIYAVDLPYTRFYGGDVYAGGGIKDIDDTCTATNSSAKLFGSMKGDSDATFSGTGTQLAAFALGQITGVQALSQSGLSPLGLSFANTGTPATLTTPATVVNTSNGEFGGGFGTLSCVNDYFADIPSTVTWDTSTDVDLSDTTLATGRHYYEGDINIFGQLPDDVDADGEGRRLVIYVDGDVSVQVNNNGSVTGKFGYANNLSWPSIKAIPSLYIIARGNILIDDGVDELDGVLIAQQSPAAPDTTGFIDTCSNNGSSLMPTSSNATALSIGCRRPLRVNGAFMAKRVNLLRTLGSLRESYPGEGPQPDPTFADPAPTIPATTRAAETFVYNPTLWFTSGGNLPAEKNIQIDSYTSLPPSL